MQLDDLKTVWVKEMEMIEKIDDFKVLREHLSQYDRKASFMWALELAACVAVIVFVGLGWFMTENPNLLFNIGEVAMIAVAVFVGGKIILERRIPIVDDWTLASKLNIQIKKRKTEVKLLKSGYW